MRRGGKNYLENEVTCPFPRKMHSNFGIKLQCCRVSTMLHSCQLNSHFTQRTRRLVTDLVQLGTESIQMNCHGSHIDI